MKVRKRKICYLYINLSFSLKLYKSLLALSTPVIMNLSTALLLELFSLVSILVTTFLLSLLINVLFTMYHLYMRKKSEYQYRLLNLLYGQLALILQFGSLLNIVIIVRCVFLMDNDILTLAIQLIRNIQVLTGFLQSTLLGWLFDILHSNYFFKCCRCIQLVSSQFSYFMCLTVTYCYWTKLINTFFLIN